MNIFTRLVSKVSIIFLTLLGFLSNWFCCSMPRPWIRSFIHWYVGNLFNASVDLDVVNPYSKKSIIQTYKFIIKEVTLKHDSSQAYLFLLISMSFVHKINTRFSLAVGRSHITLLDWILWICKAGINLSSQCQKNICQKQKVHS